MYQGSSQPGDIEMPLIAMPSVTSWHREEPIHFSPPSISLPPLYPVNNDFETGKKHFEVPLEQPCGLECVIMLCLNYYILWLMRMAGTARIQP